MTGRSFRTNGEGRALVRGLVLGNELVDANVGEDVTVVDEQGFVIDEGGNIFDATAGLEKDLFVKKVKLNAAVGTFGKSAIPLLV